MSKKIEERSKSQGYGLHSREEGYRNDSICLHITLLKCLIYFFLVYSIGRKDLKSLNDFLEGKKFLLGDEPCNEDAAVFGMMCQFLYHEKGPMNQYILSIYI